MHVYTYHTTSSAAEDPMVRSFGPGADDQPIYRAGPGCTGTEENLDACPGTNNVPPSCNHDGDVGVVCDLPRKSRLIPAPLLY